MLDRVFQSSSGSTKMRGTKVVLALCVGLLWSVGCGTARPFESEDSITLRVTRVADGVQIVNHTDESWAYAVWNPNWLGLFGPCADPGPDCVRLRPGQTVVVPEAAITGYAPGITEAVVRWWRVVPDGEGGYRAEGLQKLLLAL